MIYFDITKILRELYKSYGGDTWAWTYTIQLVIGLHFIPFWRAKEKLYIHIPLCNYAEENNTMLYWLSFLFLYGMKNCKLLLPNKARFSDKKIKWNHKTKRIHLVLITFYKVFSFQTLISNLTRSPSPSPSSTLPSKEASSSGAFTPEESSAI